jgi:hypothetical protein
VGSLKEKNKMAQANVYTSVSNQTWSTDKCRITTGDSAVTYQVNIVYGTPTAGNLYSNATSVAANWSSDVWVGAGNKLTITGSNYTAQEIGTTSSARYAVR